MVKIWQVHFFVRNYYVYTQHLDAAVASQSTIDNKRSTKDKSGKLNQFIVSAVWWCFKLIC